MANKQWIVTQEPKTHYRQQLVCRVMIINAPNRTRAIKDALKIAEGFEWPSQHFMALNAAQIEFKRCYTL